MDHFTCNAWAVVLRVSMSPCATGNKLPTACYPQCTGHVLRVKKPCALRVVFFSSSGRSWASACALDGAVPGKMEALDSARSSEEPVQEAGWRGLADLVPQLA
jgi:hypothetical protein